MHNTLPRFWHSYDLLPVQARELANKQFSLLLDNPQHPSLQFKKLQQRQGVELWSARVSENYRALAYKGKHGFMWFWIGDHKAYERMIG